MPSYAMPNGTLWHRLSHPGSMLTSWLGTSFWRVFAVSSAALFAVTAAWSLATPLYSAPDEAAHVTRAAAVVRGQFVGHTESGPQDAYTDVQVPDVFANGGYWVHCFLRHAKKSAACEIPIVNSTTLTYTSTYVGRYPPLYYAFVGLPSLAFESTTGIWLMRLMSALLNSLMLGLAIASLVRWSRNRFLLAGLLLAATPALLYLSGVVNPCGLECTAAVALWCSGLVLVTEHPVNPPRPLIAIVAISAAVLTLTRGASPLWTVLIFVFLMLQLDFAQLRALFARRDIRLATGFVALCGVLAVVWILHEHALDLIAFQPIKGKSDISVLLLVVGHSYKWIGQMVGSLGENDVVLPTVSSLFWFIAIGGVVAACIAVARLRKAAAFVLLLACVFVIPILLQYFQARRLGLIYQGRYTLPLAVGVPLLAAAVIGDSAALRGLHKRFLALLLVGAFVAQVAAFAQTVRRYAVGAQGTLAFWNGHWHPPAGAIVTFIWYLAAFALFEALLWGCFTSGYSSDSGNVEHSELSVPLASG